MNSATRLSPEKLMRAIRDKGLTYVEAAQHARRYLPDDTRLSHTSVWSYATGRATPKRLTYIEAIEKALGVEPNGLSHDGEDNAASPEERPVEAATSVELPELMLIVDDVRGNNAHLRMRASVPWPIALQILEALKGVDRRGIRTPFSG